MSNLIAMTIVAEGCVQGEEFVLSIPMVVICRKPTEYTYAICNVQACVVADENNWMLYF